MNSKNFKISLLFTTAIFLTLGLSISFQSLLAAWIAPLSNPPICLTGDPGCDAPISSGSTLVQQAQGSLWIVNSAYPTSPYGLIVEQGKVVIGAITSNYKLDVQGGQINSSGGFCINGECKTSWSQIGSTGTVTSVGSGAGLSGGPITTAGSLAINTAAISTCTGATQKILWDSVNNRFTCSTDANTDTKWDGGVTGLVAATGRNSLGLGSLATLNTVTSANITDGTITSADINNTSVQQRVSGTCADGTSINAINANGTVTCQAISTSQSVAWSDIDDTPTNLSGYGITDAASISHVHDGYLTPSSYIDFSKITGNKYSYILAGGSCLSGDTPIAYRTAPTTCNSTDCSSGSCITGSHQWLPTRQSLETCYYAHGVEYTYMEYTPPECYPVAVTCYAQEYVLCVPIVCPSCGAGEICRSGQCYKPPYKAVFADGSTQYFDSLNVTFDLRAVAPISAVINGVGVGFGSISRTLSVGSSYTVSLTSDNGGCDSCGGYCEGVYGKIIFSDGVGKIITSRANRTAGCIVATEFNNGWVDTQCCGNCCYTNYQTTFTVSNNN